MDKFDQLQPKVRPDISFSPGERKGHKTVYYVNDRFTDQFYRIGEREHFLFTRMDGRATLAEIGRDYEAHFGKRLNEQSWEGLFKLLEERQMLEGSADEEKLTELKRVAREKRHKEGQGWFNKRFHLVNPDGLLERLLPWVRFMFRPGVVFSGLAAIVVVEVWVLMNLGTLRAAAWNGRGLAYSWALFIGLILFFALLHEMGHGMACKYYGGVVNDMGIMWRYLYFFPYCKLDHIILFHNRWHRVYVAAAGTYVGLLLMLPFTVLWWLSPAQSLASVISAKMLTWYNFITLLNLVPFIQLDGYFMLAHALGMADLRQESNSFIYKVAKHRLLGRGEGAEGYSKKEKRIYFVYGVISFLMTASIMAFILTFWYRFAVNRFSYRNALAMVAGILCLIVLRRVGVGWIKKLYQRWHPSGNSADPLTSQN